MVEVRGYVKRAGSAASRRLFPRMGGIVKYCRIYPAISRVEAYFSALLWRNRRQTRGRRAVGAGDGRRPSGADPVLLPGAQAANVGMVLAEDQDRHDQDEQQPSLADDEVIEDDRPGGDKRGERGIAVGDGDRRPGEAEQERRRPVQPE